MTPRWAPGPSSTWSWPHCRARRTRPCYAPSSASSRPPSSPTPRRSIARRPGPGCWTRSGPWPGRPCPAATPSSSSVSAAAGLTVEGDDTAYLAGLLDGSALLDGLEVDTDLRWTLLTALAAARAVGEAAIDAEKARDDTATGRERAARALASIPTPELKAAAWREAVEKDGLPNSVVDAVALGFGRAGAPDVLRPYVDRYHAMLDTIERKGSHAIIEAIVTGFYPRALADAELRDATQSWIDTHPDAPDALVRLVCENRDGVARALAAQARDARD